MKSATSQRDSLKIKQVSIQMLRRLLTYEKRDERSYLTYILSVLKDKYAYVLISITFFASHAKVLSYISLSFSKSGVSLLPSPFRLNKLAIEGGLALLSDKKVDA